MNEWDLDSPPARSAAPDPSGMGPATAPAKAAGPGLAPALSKSRSWFLLVFAGLVLLVAGALSGFYLARSYSSDAAAELLRTQEELGELQRAHSQTEERNGEYYRQLEALRTENAGLREELAGAGASGTHAAPTEAPGTAAAGGSYGDGIYLVGVGLPPGTYDGEVVAEVGYWARLRATDGTVGAIIANALVRGPFVLTVLEADKAVELRGVEITLR